MPIKDVRSPVTRKGSKVASGQPMSPGARSNPDRRGGAKFDSVPPQPTHARTSVGAEEGGTTKIVGPED
jgi:hypothetical protein